MDSCRLVSYGSHIFIVSFRVSFSGRKIINSTLGIRCFWPYVAKTTVYLASFAIW